MHCTIFLSAHVCLYMLDHAESEFEKSTEQAQAEDPANLALDQGNPDALQPMFLVFLFESLIYVLF
jgi:hypothetical protein